MDYLYSQTNRAVVSFANPVENADDEDEGTLSIEVDMEDEGIELEPQDLTLVDLATPTALDINPTTADRPHATLTASTAVDSPPASQPFQQDDVSARCTSKLFK
jgi:hypothetical protein